MTSQSGIFDRRVNPIAPVEASLKSILSGNRKTKIFKICNFACSNPIRVEHSLRFALSVMVSEITAIFLVKI